MATIAERTKYPHVLLIEDNIGDAAMIRMAFAKTKVPSYVTVAPTAEVGLKVLRREGEYADKPSPDIILLDFNVVYKGGCDFLKLVKADPVLSLIPTIVLSSYGVENDLVKIYADYANGFVIKPITLDDYDHVVAIIAQYWFTLVETPKPYEQDVTPVA